jgi:peptidoglycan DL-endopeptidase CwlO
VHTAPLVRRILRRRVTAVAVAVVASGLLIGVAGSATAAPTPTLAQVKANLSKLQAQLDKLSQQYDQVQQQLSATNQRLAVINKQEASYAASFAAMRQQVGQLAITAYEDGNFNSSLALLSSGSPQQILNRSSILQELSASNNAKISQFLVDAKQLNATQTLAERTQAGIESLRNNLAGQKAAMTKLVSQQQALVAQLTPAQAATVSPGAGGTTSAVYTGTTATQAGKAVAFAYSKLGCPYAFGGTGPCGSGYDCSGLTQAAWAAAGVSIPRTSESQWAGLPHVSSLQPGEIMVFNGAGHVGIYVGNNELIDAPHTGLDVELVAFSGWYQSTYDGAVRP